MVLPSKCEGFGDHRERATGYGGLSAKACEAATSHGGEGEVAYTQTDFWYPA